MLHEDVQHIPVRVHCPPEPVFAATYWDDDFVQLPFVGRRRPIAFDTISEMATKAVHPFLDGLPADHHTSFGEQVLDISRAEREAEIDPDRVGEDRTWEAVTFQAGHGEWHHLRASHAAD